MEFSNRNKPLILFFAAGEFSFIVFGVPICIQPLNIWSHLLTFGSLSIIEWQKRKRRGNTRNQQNLVELTFCLYVLPLCKYPSFALFR